MSKGKRITKKTFDILHQMIIDQFQKECKSKNEIPPEDVNQLYGFGKGYDHTKPNIAHFMKLNSDSGKFISKTINGKNLYNLNNSYKSYKFKYHTEVIKQPFLSIYLAYLGYANLESFLEDKLRGENLEVQKVLSTQSEKELTKYTIWYTGFYYSFQSHDVLGFSFAIDYYNKNYTEVKGFYNNGLSVPFVGTAEYRNKSLFLNLKNDEEERLNIILYSGASYQNGKIINGVYQGVSPSSNNLRIGELILLKNEVAKDGEIDKESTEELHIKRYLMLQRKKERVRSEIYESFKSMRSNGYKIDEIEKLVGNYRVWGLDRKSNIFQSKLTIGKYYKTYYESPFIAGKQVCILKINETDGKRHLCLSCHQPEGTNITSYAILEIPSQANRRGGKVMALNGTFCLFESDKGVYSSYIILTRESNDINEFEKEVEAKIIKSEASLELEINNNPRLIEMRERLYKILKDNQVAPKF